VQDVDLKIISATENSNKFQKIRFWKEKSDEDAGNTWPNGTDCTSMFWKKTTGTKS
jgi:hypothetical protein